MNNLRRKIVILLTLTLLFSSMVTVNASTRYVIGSRATKLDYNGSAVQWEYYLEEDEADALADSIRVGKVESTITHVITKIPILGDFMDDIIEANQQSRNDLAQDIDNGADTLGQNQYLKVIVTVSTTRTGITSISGSTRKVNSLPFHPSVPSNYDITHVDYIYVDDTI